MLFGGFPRVLAGPGLGGHRRSFGVPGGGHFGSPGSSFWVPNELSCGRIGTHVAFGTLGELNRGRLGTHFRTSAGLRSLVGMNSFHNSGQLTIQSAQLN